MADELLCEMDGVPSWLDTPVTGVPSVSPPVQTRPQVLPLNDLSWEHFERLCLRYVRGRTSVVMTQLYGTPGQKQDGIDLYVRLAAPPRYEVYQCKRLETFEAGDIKEALQKFLDGKWREKASAFRIMTSHPIEDRKIADAIVAGQSKLSEHGIEFEVLGKEQISAWLKDQPRVVDDFFSRGWVHAFCGSDTLQALENRLNAEQVAKYRVQLKRFYEVLFSRYDPGIPVRVAIGDKELPLRERFVVPEIVSSLVKDERLRKPEEVPGPTPDLEGRRQNVSPAVTVGTLRTRIGADAWIAQSGRSVILGGPGSGKSALLRTLAVELLSPEPVFPQAAFRWGRMLPVWVPFSFWTSLNTRRDSPISLSECLAIWFKQFDQAGIWPLVESAINDERLLLLVDGLDEWTDEAAARTTSTILQTFIQLRNLPAVLVSRPHGFERVSVQGADWQVGQLAALSASQQRELVFKWLKIHRSRLAERSSQDRDMPKIEIELADTEAGEFIRRLERSRDLVELAEVPLTLLLLLYLHLQNTPLPTSRFEAYEYVVKHFIQEHPLSRKAASSTGDASVLTHQEVLHALAYIAYAVQTKFPTGVLTPANIHDILDEFLRDNIGYGLGLNRQEALDVMRSFTNVEEGSLGLLVSQGQSQISFFHRALQEYLAAVHLARTPLSSQTEAIRVNLADARWREVIIGLIFLCRRGEDTSSLVDAIESLDTDAIGSLAKEDILAEVAFKSTNLPPDRVKGLVARAFGIIENSPVESQRRRVLGHALSGLHLRKNRTLIQDRIKRWIFSRGLWGPGRIEGIESWPATNRTWDILLRELHDEDGSVIRAAAKVIAKLFAGDAERGGVIGNMALRSESPYQRAACLEALGKGWPQHDLLKVAIENGRKCNSEEVRIAAILVKVHLGTRDDEDLEQLLGLGHHRIHSSLQYAWRDEVATNLATGWSGNPLLKQECLNSIHHHFRRPELIDYETAAITLLKGFPQDNEVAEFVVSELREQYAFSSAQYEIWRLLPECFRDHPAVVAALDEWVLEKDRYDPLSLHFASLVGRTPVMKNQLLQATEKYLPFWAVGSLLSGWGMADSEVAAKLIERAQRDDASEFAQHLPVILSDPRAARERLLHLLRDPRSHRIDFLMEGFSNLADKGDVGEIVDAALARFSEPRVKHAYAGYLISGFYNDSRVRALARESLHSQAPFLSAIVQVAATDEQLQAEVAEFITPLSSYLRYQIVLDLPAFADQTFALGVLREWDSERNAEVKTQASVQYHTVLMHAGGDTVEAAKDLESLLPAYGPDHKERREAAAAGLIVLKQLSTIVGKLETVGFTGKQVNIPVSDGLPNRVFLELLGRYWLYIKAAIGEQWEIFEDRIGTGKLWGLLAEIAPEHPALANDILERADSDWGLKRSGPVLRLLSRIDPKSERLASTCISVLADRSEPYAWYNWYESVEAAADILADQFRGDSEIERRIVTIASENLVPTGVVMALSLGWPHNLLLRQLQFDHRRSEVSAAELYTKYAVASATKLPQLLEADLAWARHNQFQVPMLTKPLLARLRVDAEVANQIFMHLKTSVSPGVRASFPRLLAATGEMTAERADWCRRELGRQQLLRSPEIGYDVLARAPRSICVCLLESLGDTPPADAQVSHEP